MFNVCEDGDIKNILIIEKIYIKTQNIATKVKIKI